jgi:dTDP-4-amino-4,6-dideoxygalactose transaminase
MATRTSTEQKIPFLDLRRATAELRPELDQALDRVLASGVYLRGEQVAGFEAEFAAAMGTAYAVGVGSGTDALELALRGVGVRPGDEVVTQANTCVPTVDAISRAGGIPVLCDVALDSATMDVDSLAGALSGRTRAVVPVHLHGQCVDLEAITQLAERAGIAVVEDCAHAHGATYEGRPAGSVGHAGCFSFYPTKNLGALGDSGAVVTRDAALAERVRALAAGSRMDEIQAAVLRVKLPHLAAANRRRVAIADRYREALAGTGALPLELLPGRDQVFHHFVVRTPWREQFRARLKRGGVGTAVHYPLAVHQHPSYRQLAEGPVPLARAERLAETVVSLPLYPQLDDREVEAVAQTARAAAQ